MSVLNAASKRLLDTAFGDASHAWLVRGHYDANDELAIIQEGPAGSFALPDGDDLYYCVATVDGSRKKAKRVYALVIDDVGKEINRELFEMAFPLRTAFIGESSNGSYHYTYFIDGGMPEKEFKALRLAMRASPIWGDAHNTGAVALYRLPQGTHTKSTHGGWKVREELWAGIKYTPEQMWAALAPAGAPRTPARGSEGDLVEDEGLLRALVALIPNPAADWDLFVNVGRAIWGASDGAAFEIFDEWAAKCPAYDAEITKARWDSYYDARIGRFWLMRQAMEADKAGVEDWLRAESKVEFDDGATMPPPTADEMKTTMFTVDDFRAVSGEVDFIHVDTGKFWKAVNVDAKVPAVDIGKKEPKFIKATAWMRMHRQVNELSWLPGRERIIENAAIGVTGLEWHVLLNVFNLYTAPPIVPVEEIDARMWCDLVRKLWPYEYDEIMNWFAHRVQHPGEKCNHALVLGGAPGIGKDTVLEAVRRAVGEGNCAEITPSHLRGSFNDHIKSVLLTINELRDDGSVSQFAFHELTKTLIAAPPYTLSVNTKYVKPYVVPNVCGVVMTTNHKQTGLYLPADDRRHLVAWSEEPAIGEDDTTFKEIWAWMNGGGFDHVAAWLRARDLSKFDCKAPPRKTQAFFDIVEAAGSGQEKAMQDKMERMGTPHVLRVKDLKADIKEAMDDDGGASILDTFLTDPKYKRVLAEALDRAGYRQVRNPSRADGRWKINGKPEIIYGRKDVDRQELIELARKLAENDDKMGGNA